MIARRLLTRTAAALLRALGASLRVRTRGPDPLAAAETAPGARIGAFWHRGLLLIAWLYRDRGYSVAVSRSRDGDWIAAALPALGYAPPVRGSSSRGATAALRGMLRLVRGGTTVAVLCDGPRGPAGRAKPGVVALARLSGVPITPVAIAAWPSLRLPSWDGMLLPLPFARVVVRYGEPLAVPPDADLAQEEAIRRRLDTDLAALSAAADAEARGAAAPGTGG